MKNEDIAKVCHSVNTAYCHGIGDETAVSWEDAPESQKKSVVEGVAFHLNGNQSPEESHEAWMDYKVEEGWVYGEVKDEEKKEHPCLVPYAELPEAHRVKDFLFAAVVDAMAVIEVAVVSTVSDMDEGDERKMAVKYIGKRNPYSDTFIKGLVWEIDETKMIVNSIARKMMVHFDVYSDGDHVEAVEVVKEPESNKLSDEEDLNEETRHQIRQMNRKAPIVDFIKDQWGIETEIGTKTVKDLQEEAMMHMDNLGLIGND